MQVIDGVTFIRQNGYWTDTRYQPDAMTPIEIEFLSDAYFDLLDQFPAANEYLALGENVVVVLDGTAYRITGVPASE